jgi:hypothetical protein
MDFHIRGISPQPFRKLFALSDEALARQGIQRMIVDDAAGYPCRVSLSHASLGDEVLLASFQHQDADTPYRATGPIFVSRAATTAFDARNLVPAPVRIRLLSFRAYDGHDRIVEAEVAEGREFEAMIQRLFARADVAYVHVHYARRGCFACRVDRVD